MNNREFKRIAEKKKGCALILAGSDSDMLHIEKIIDSLSIYRIPYEVRICSAHKTPGKLIALIKEYSDIDGAIAFIAVARGTDALSGTLSFHTLNPVISCPPDPERLNESCLMNPPGSSNGFIAHPQNVGKFIAQMYAPFNPEYRKLLIKYREQKINDLEQKDREFQKKYRSV